MIVSLGTEIEPFVDELFNFADSVEVCSVIISFVEILFAAKFIVQEDLKIWFFILSLFKLLEILWPICHDCIFKYDSSVLRVRIIQIMSLIIKHWHRNFKQVLNTYRYNWLHARTPIFWTKTVRIWFILVDPHRAGLTLGHNIKLILSLQRCLHPWYLITFKN